MKTLCALIGAFFLVAGIAILIAGPAKRSPRAGLTASSAAAARSTARRPLVWEADVVHARRAGSPDAAEAAARNR